MPAVVPVWNSMETYGSVPTENSSKFVSDSALKFLLDFLLYNLQEQYGQSENKCCTNSYKCCIFLLENHAPFLA